jgi:hypothetical protein
MGQKNPVRKSLGMISANHPVDSTTITERIRVVAFDKSVITQKERSHPASITTNPLTKKEQ